MEKLDQCDFCAETAAGAFDPIPSELADSSQTRLVLCTACYERLERILEPFQKYVHRTSREANTASERGGTAIAFEDDDTESHTGTSKSSTDSESSTPATTDESGATTDANGSTTTNSDTDKATDSDADKATDSDTDKTTANGNSSQPATDSSDSVQLPRGYGKVMRLLENRSFPLDKSEATTLAMSAYDLEAGDVTAIIECAVEAGEFEDRDGTLYRA